MAVRGIDSPLMLNRAAELAPERARASREHDTSQSQTANSLIAKTVRDQHRTLAAQKVEHAKVSLDNEKEGDGTGDDTPKRKKKGRDVRNRAETGHIDITLDGTMLMARKENGGIDIKI